jgi:hypothetical protein
MAQITSKYPGTCRTCGKSIAVGALVEWEKADRSIRHTSCPKRLRNDPVSIQRAQWNQLTPEEQDEVREQDRQNDLDASGRTYTGRRTLDSLFD